MKNRIFVQFLFIILGIASFSAFLTSCSDDDSYDTIESTENFVEQSVYSLQTEANCGKMGCYEFVFPLTIEYPDGTTESVDDYATLRTSLRTWYEANYEDLDLPAPDSLRRFRHGYIGDIPWDILPSLSYPLEVLSEDGEVITVSSREELAELRQECRRSFYGNRGRHGHGKGDRCFNLVFPLTVVFPDGTTATADDRQALKTELRTWRAANPDSEERPSLSYPVTVEMEDGSTVEVASQEELEALKESCSSEE